MSVPLLFGPWRRRGLFAEVRVAAVAGEGKKNVFTIEGNSLLITHRKALPLPPLRRKMERKKRILNFFLHYFLPMRIKERKGGPHHPFTNPAKKGFLSPPLRPSQGKRFHYF